MREQNRLLALLTLTILGCGDATGTVQGGEYLLATDAAGSTVMAGDSGPSWQTLYTKYFGPTGSAPCGGSSACHAVGGTAAGFWVCGSSAKACWDGITVTLVPKGGTQDPTSTSLFAALRTSTCSATAPCNMPSQSTYVFTASDLAQIGAWIQAGAANN